MADKSATCPNCGGTSPLDSLSGQCPACLLRIGLALGGQLQADEALEAGGGDTGKASGYLCRIGEYEVIEQIAQGGMGVVYKARQVRLNRWVALKMIRAGELANEAEIARFRIEAESAANLDHPNIAPIYEIGEDQGRRYYSMKLVDGGSLASLSAQCRKRDLEWQRQMVRLLIQITRAVHYAHQHGILHRDLKPGNVLLDQQGQPQVTDFGLAKRVEGASDLTLSGAILGTPSYMAPEQTSGSRGLSTAADIYSLGAILYELITGQPPFQGATALDTLMQARESEPLLPNALNPETHPELETICLKCLEKSPDRRYGSAVALAEDLERWLAHEPILARPSSVAEKAIKWAQRRPAVAALALGMPFLAFVCLIMVLWEWRGAVEARGAAEQATRAKAEQLWQSQLQEARSYRLTGGPGQRLRTLQVIKEAASYRTSVELRDEAIAALVLPDLSSNLWWHAQDNPLVPSSFSHDLALFAPIDDSGQISVYRAKDQVLLSKCEGLGPRTVYTQFSPGDRLLAVRHYNGKVGVWDWQNSRLVFSVQSWPEGPSAPSFDFTQDASEIWLFDTEEHLARYRISDGQRLTVTAKKATGRVLRLDPTGFKLLTANDDVIAAWDIRSGQQLGEWKLPSDISAIAWHPDGSRFAFETRESGLFLGEVGNPKLDLLEHSEGSSLNHLQFTPDGGLLLAGGWGNTMVIWRVASGRALLQDGQAWFLQLSEDGRQFAYLQERRGYGARQLIPPIGIRQVHIPAVLGKAVYSASWHPSGNWFVLGHPMGWSLWSAKGSLLTFRDGIGSLRSVEFLPNGEGFLSGGSNGPQLWPIENDQEKPRVGQSSQLLPIDAQADERATLSRDGTRFAAIGRGGLFLGSLSGEHRSRRLEGSHWESFVAFDSSGRWIYCGGHQGTEVEIFDATTGTLTTNLPAGTGYGWFVPGRPELVTVGPNLLSLWRLGTWERLREVKLQDLRATGGLTGFWPGTATWLLTSTDSQMKLVDSERLTPVATFRLPEFSSSWGSFFDPAGRLLVTTGGRSYASIWDPVSLRKELGALGLDWLDR